jgi:hypothetical protein
MATFKQIKTDDADLTRVQQNVATAFAAIPGASDPTFVRTSDAQYRIVGDEGYLFVDASARAVTVVLPPSGAAPVIKRIDSSAQVVIIQPIDGTKINGVPQIILLALNALHLVFDGKAWWTV